MDYAKLKYFVSAAYSLNFSEVARLNFISQPTISHQIDMLESELGVKLFIRNGKRLALTNEGEFFLPMAVRLIDEMNDAMTKVKQYSEGVSGKLDIMLSETSVAYFRECLAAFSTKYPDVVVEMHCPVGPEILQSVINGDYDLYFTFENLIKNIEEYEYAVVGRDRLSLALPMDAPFPEDPEDFSCMEGMKYIGLSDTVTNFIHRDIQTVFEHRHYEPKVINLYNKLSELLISVELGIGFTIMPYSLAGISNRKVRYIPLDDDCGKVNCVIAWRKKHHNRAAELFVETVKNMYEKQCE